MEESHRDQMGTLVVRLQRPRSKVWARGRSGPDFVCDRSSRKGCRSQCPEQRRWGQQPAGTLGTQSAAQEKEVGVGSAGGTEGRGWEDVPFRNRRCATGMELIQGEGR